MKYADVHDVFLILKIQAKNEKLFFIKSAPDKYLGAKVEIAIKLITVRYQLWY